MRLLHILAVLYLSITSLMFTISMSDSVLLLIANVAAILTTTWAVAKEYTAIQFGDPR